MSEPRTQNFLKVVMIVDNILHVMPSLCYLSYSDDYEWYCPWNHECMSFDTLCDGIEDCPGLDEIHCPNCQPCMYFVLIPYYCFVVQIIGRTYSFVLLCF